ncbi:histidine-containing phosphotransfer protein 1-like [Coffea eugenioides]|uniref:histidine-containing phosphotransfer protein 1-like n=1 Tax=Coffea eugenioides TaxID=49369 RepID=UPI000F60A8FF|nr:histidine-containing phosphotransfer protein 1-like [Coffea eugenioides]XP_027160618.1 histidine-containing phosphotransfer protein 1-like [Coffea eugenioides]
MSDQLTCVGCWQDYYCYQDQVGSQAWFAITGRGRVAVSVVLHLSWHIDVDFVVEVVSLFFEDSEKLLNNVATALQQPIVDFKQVDAYVHQFKGSSSSIGAQRVKNACGAFRNFCEEKNLDGCLKCLQHAKNEYALVKSKLEYLFMVSVCLEGIFIHEAWLYSSSIFQ